MAVLVYLCTSLKKKAMHVVFCSVFRSPGGGRHSRVVIVTTQAANAASAVPLFHTVHLVVLALFIIKMALS
jgi:hypothetical protein